MKNKIYWGFHEICQLDASRWDRNPANFMSAYNEKKKTRFTEEDFMELFGKVK